MTDMNDKAILDKNHMPIETREYHYTRQDGSKVVIQDHSAGHPAFPGEPAAKPHINVRPLDGLTGNAERTGKVSGTSGHYTFGAM